MKKFKKRKGAKPIGLRNEKMFDSPPSDFSVQEIPRSLKEFMQLKESAKNSENDRRKVKSRSSKPTIPDKSSKSNTAGVSNQKVSSLLKKQTDFDTESHLESSVVECRKGRMKQKKKLKLIKLKNKRKQKRLQNDIEIEKDKLEFVKDSIKFGEVVHRPPQLSVLPRKVAQTGFQNRPGRKDDLLLKSLLKKKYSKLLP